MREAMPALKASWDILQLEAVRQPDTDLLVHDSERSATQDPEISDVHRAIQIFEIPSAERTFGIGTGS